MGYRSPEDSPEMLQYRQAMAECINLPRCQPVAPSNYVPSNGGAMMGRGGGGGGHGGGGHGGHGGGRGGFGHGGFPRGGRFFGGGGWGDLYPGVYYIHPCDYDPFSYECYVENLNAFNLRTPWNNTSNIVVGQVGNGTDYYSRVQAANLFPRVRF